MGRLLDLIFCLSANLWKYFLQATLPNNQNAEIRSIALLPYTAPNRPGGQERLANWKIHIEKAGYCVNIFWPVAPLREGADNPETTWKRYMLYFRTLWKRGRDFRKIATHDVVWVQRAVVPYYPFSKAMFETLLKRKVHRLVVDFYDADYESNFRLTVQTAMCAAKVSVSTPHLKSFMAAYNEHVQVLPMTIDCYKYISRRDYEVKDKIRIGWMGSPGNALHLVPLFPVFEQIAMAHPEMEFSFVCNHFPARKPANIVIHSFGDTHFDYLKWIQSIDIGVVPYFGASERLKGKSSMKILEFMASGIPVVASPYAIHKGMTGGREFLLADKPDDWQAQLSRLMADQDLRRDLGNAGRHFVITEHSYQANLRKVLDLLDRWA